MRPQLRFAAGLLLTLAALAPAVAADGFVEANGESLHYRLSGHGPNTIVLLHEMGTTLDTWNPIVPELEKNHRVLRYDLRGFGLSEKIYHSVSFSDEVADFDALLGKLRISGPVTLMGGAVGGAIAIDFAATYPGRVKALIALSPAIGTPPDQRAAAMANADRVAEIRMRPYLDQSMDDIYPPQLRTNPARLALFRALQLSTDTASMAATLRMIAGTDFTPLYPKITAPTLIVAAGLYKARPAAAVKRIADAIPGAQFVALPTGHFMALESPGLLMGVVEPFLRKTGG